MNPKILELATQARIQMCSDARLQEFAELIIRECISQIEIEKGNPYRNMGDIYSYGTGACIESIRRIKEHFGVGE